jgi:WD40 repeat protein/serine/threonine protein kinase
MVWHLVQRWSILLRAGFFPTSGIAVVEAEMSEQLPAAPDAASTGNHDGDSSRTLNLKNLQDRSALPGSEPEFSPAATVKLNTLDSPLLGDYELLAVVGRGGMGAVYKARHRSLNRIVALKVTHAAHLISTEAAQRFQIEAAAIARLDHPNIVPIYEIGEAFGQQFYSMAFVEGTSLAHAVAVSPLPPRRAAELIQPVARAVAYAHSQGVVHRDLKPENILLDATDRPRITDFGIAKCSGTDSRLTQAGEVIGTPCYMSPEQAMGQSEQIGPLSDVYSLGATLYCLLTGRPPFQAASSFDTLKHVVDREPVSPRRLNPAVDRDLETICLKCLEKSPERRYPTAEALADDLQRFLEHRPIVARALTPVEKATRWFRRNPFVAASLTSVVVVFLAAFALVSWSLWRANEARDDARRHEKAERWERYRANMSAAASAFQSHNVSVARQAIDAAPTEHRNWEWHHFRNLLDESRQVLPGHNHTVDRIRFVGNSRLATVEHKLRLWDLSTGKMTREFDDYFFGRWPLIEVDPGGQMLAYPGRDNSIVLWDVVADRLAATMRDSEAPFAGVRFAPDGKTLTACSHQFQAHVWDTATGNSLRKWSLQEGASASLGFDIGDQQILVSNHPNFEGRLWDIQTGQKQARMNGQKYRVVSAALNREGTRVVTAEGYPGNVLHLWDAQSGKQIALLRGHTNQADCVSFSPDGKRIASCSFDQTVRLWDGMTGEPIATLQGHSGRVLSIAFSPDSTRLISGSQDHTLRLWDAVNGQLIAVLSGHETDVYSVAYSPDGSLIASGSSDRTARVWDAKLAERNGYLRGHTDFVYSVAFHPDGERLASGSWDGSIRIWNATSGQETAVMRAEKPAIIFSVALDPSGKVLAALYRNNTVRLWDVETGLQLHQWSIPADHWFDGRLAFSPKGNLLAAGSKDGPVHVWNALTHESWAVLQGHSQPVHDVAFSPDGLWLASSGADDDSSVRIWDVEKKTQLQVLEGHTHGTMCVAFSKNGELLASGSNDGSVRLWSTATWKQVGLLQHGTTVYGVAFTPDGTRLATGCADNSIRFWDVASQKEVVELRGHGSYVKAIAFSPDGSRLASASGDATVRIWDTLSTRERTQR